MQVVNIECTEIRIDDRIYTHNTYKTRFGREKNYKKIKCK
jgi:hypothetical protein